MSQSCFHLQVKDDYPGPFLHYYNYRPPGKGLKNGRRAFRQKSISSKKYFVKNCNSSKIKFSKKSLVKKK